MTASSIGPISPPERLLVGPGPANFTPSVLAAMQKPILGYMDPDVLDILDEVVELQREVYRAPEGGLVIPLQATGTAGMEAGIASLLSPGEKMIVGHSGYFGRRIADIARRYGIELIEVAADWGHVASNAAILEAFEQHPEARVVAVVHGETSTGAEHPVAELGAALRDHPDVMLYVDCVTTLGGVEFDFAGWGVDYAYSCTQKCLGAPPGMSPVAISEAAMEVIRTRHTRYPFSFDFELLEAYWVRRPAVYHHTAPILNIYALHEAMRVVVEEGLDARWRRHSEAGAHLQEGLRARGLELLADPAHQLSTLSAVRVPQGVDAKGIQHRLLHEHAIEIGGGLGPTAPSMWRLGLMGHNATIAVADRILEGFDAVLADEPGFAAR